MSIKSIPIFMIFLSFFPVWLGATEHRKPRVEAKLGQKQSDGGKTVIAKAVFDASVEEVWNVMSDLNKFAEFLPYVKVCESIGVVDGKERFYAKLNPPAFPNIWYIVALDFDKSKNEITWKMVDGNIKQNDGTAVLTATPNGTELNMNFIVRLSGLNAVVAWAAKTFVPNVLEEVDHRILFLREKSKSVVPTVTPTIVSAKKTKPKA